MWSWWQQGSIHNAAWPTGDELRAAANLHSAGHSAGHPAGHPDGHPAGHPAGHPDGHSADHSADHSAGHSDGHSADHSADDPAWLEPLSEVLAMVRRAKTEAKVSQRAEVSTLTVHAPVEVQMAVERAVGDLRDAGSITTVVFHDAADTRCEVELAPVAEPSTPATTNPAPTTPAPSTPAPTTPATTDS